MYGVYGGDEFAMKSAEHELKVPRVDCARKGKLLLQGTMAILDTRIPGLHTALVALIHHRGYTLVAQSYLPIGRDTLIYGSSDGAETVNSKDDKYLLSFTMCA